MNRFSEGFEFDEDGEPHLDINMKMGEDSVQLNINRDNTAIFTHQPPYHHLDHIFVELETTEEEDSYRTLGAFIWRQVLPDWDDLKEALDQHWFQHIRSPFPSEQDQEQYEATGLLPPSQNFIKTDSGLLVPEPKVIEEVEDDAEVERAMSSINSELDWFLNDPHYYDRIKPRKEDE